MKTLDVIDCHKLTMIWCCTVMTNNRHNCIP